MNPGLPQRPGPRERPADDDRRPRAAHRVRQRREPPAGARRGAAEGDRGAAVARRGPRPPRPSAAHRRHAARAPRRRRRDAARATGRRGCSGRSARRSCRPTRSICIPTGACSLFTLGVVARHRRSCSAWRPAIQASRPNLVVELKERTGAPSGSNRLFGLRNLLVAAQVALSLIALVGAGLFLRSLQNAQRIDPGLRRRPSRDRLGRPRRAGLHRGARPPVPAADARARERGARRAGGHAGRRHPALQRRLRRGRCSSKGRTRPISARAGSCRWTSSAPTTCETMGIPLMRGRDVQPSPTSRTRRSSCVVNETMAKQFWPDQDAIGKRFKFFGQDYFTAGRRHREGQQVQLHRRGADAVHLPGARRRCTSRRSRSSVKSGESDSGARHDARRSAADGPQHAAHRRLHAEGHLRSVAVGAADGRVRCSRSSPGCRWCSRSSASTA